MAKARGKVESADRPARPKPRQRKSPAEAGFHLETHAFYWFSRILSRRNRVLKAIKVDKHGRRYEEAVHRF